jgi:hypothetical protein
MDGINPTLAFAVLFFGISGNGREATDDPPTEVEIESGSGCPALMIAVDPSQPASQETWAEAFWDSAANASGLPDVIDPKWADSAFPEIEGLKPTGDAAPAALAPGSDPIIRPTVPVSTNGRTADPEIDPCGLER